MLMLMLLRFLSLCIVVVGFLESILLIGSGLCESGSVVVFILVLVVRVFMS